jgi:hypothetical protein
LSFAVKLSPNEWEGRAKASQEELRHLTGALSMLHGVKQRYLNEIGEGEEGMSFSFLQFA